MNTALVTGGTDGIGRAIALRLAASRGTRVIVVGRDTAKGLACVRALQDATGNPAVEFVRADLSTIAGADALASTVLGRVTSLTYLVHSAGTFAKRRTLTSDGYEVMFATNFLSRFVLTERLRGILERAGRPKHPARVLFVSGGARGGTLPYGQTPNAPRYRLPTAIQQYALANDLYALYLADRARQTDAPIEAICLKLGPVKTAMRRDFPLWLELLATLVFDPLISQTPDEAGDAATRLLQNRSSSDSAAVLFGKIRKLRPLQATGRLADSEERRRLVEWAERLADSARQPSAAAD